MADLIDFDNGISQIYKKTTEYLSQIGNFYSFLCGKYINLEELNKNCENLVKMNEDCC